MILYTLARHEPTRLMSVNSVEAHFERGVMVPQIQTPRAMMSANSECCVLSSLIEHDGQEYKIDLMHSCIIHEASLRSFVSFQRTSDVRRNA